MLALVLKERFDSGAPHWFHPPLPLCGLDDAPHQASRVQDRQGVHAFQPFIELRSQRKWQIEGGREGRMCHKELPECDCLCLLSLVCLSAVTHHQEGYFSSTLMSTFATYRLLITTSLCPTAHWLLPLQLVQRISIWIATSNAAILCWNQWNS